MIRKLRRSTVELIKAVLCALCALTWLPNWPVERADWPRIVLPVLCAAAGVFFLSQFFKNRRAEK